MAGSVTLSRFCCLLFILCVSLKDILAENEPVEDEIVTKHEDVMLAASMVMERSNMSYNITTDQKGSHLNTGPMMVPIKPTSLGFVHAFVASLSVIVVSEIGDKTFFIAAIMAMKHSRLTVFAGAISALALMTVLSVAFGWAATVIPRAYTYYISTALFAIFGLKMLREGYKMSSNEGQEEFDEVQSDLRKRDDERDASVVVAVSPSEAAPPDATAVDGAMQPLAIAAKEDDKGAVKTTGLQSAEDSQNLVGYSQGEEFEKEQLTDPESGKKTTESVVGVVSRVILQAFTMTFLAEWGDRSQLTTIILAAREDVYGVTVGGILGHSLCTGVAVLGGRFVAQRISIRTVTLIGGVVFLIFAVSALFFDPMAT